MYMLSRSLLYVYICVALPRGPTNGECAFWEGSSSTGQEIGRIHGERIARIRLDRPRKNIGVQPDWETHLGSAQ